MGQAKKDGLSWGCLGASVLPLLHAAVFVVVVAVVEPHQWPTTWPAIWSMAVRSAWLLTAYVGTFILLVPLILVLALKDRDARGFLRRNWPIVAAVTYPFWGGWIVPGPFDDIVVLGLGGLLEVWFVAQRMLLAKELGEGLDEAQQRQLMGKALEPQSLPPAHLPALQPGVASSPPEFVTRDPVSAPLPTVVSTCGACGSAALDGTSVCPTCGAALR